jgi:translation initiation factor IF-1
VSAWNLRVGDRVAAVVDPGITGTVTALMPLGEYEVKLDDGQIERGCREHLMRKVKR